MENISLSVIIPNYNNEKYISTCLNSILQQTYLPNEIIIVDDFSNDSSREILKEFEKNHDIVKVLYLPENKGVSNARNQGLAIAKSEYVTFTDGDDYYFSKDKLKNEIELIKKHREKGEEIVAYSPYVLVNEDDEVIDWPNQNKKKFVEGNCYYDLLARVKIRNNPRDYCVSRKLMNSVGAYSYKENFYEDLDLVLRLSQKVKFFSTYELGIAYRQKTNGLSRRSKEDHKNTVNAIVDKYLSEMELVIRTKIRIKKFIYQVLRDVKRYLKK